MRLRPPLPHLRVPPSVLLGLAALAADAGELPDHPARAGETTVSWEVLDTVLLDRHAATDPGRFVLQHLLKTELLESLAQQAGVEVTAAELSARWREVDRAAREAGAERGLLEEIEAGGRSPEEFRELLRLAIVQERLTRRALGLAPGEPVTGDQQTLWIEQELAERGAEFPPPPWPDGVAARCGPLDVEADELARAMRTDLPSNEVRDACTQLLLVERLREHMPDLSADAEAAAIENEIERRRRRVAVDPTYGGVDFESLLRARGITPELFARDPAVVAAALTTLWVDRAYGEEGLREVYEAERELFEDRYGEAVETWVLFLSAARRPNALQPRSTEEARETLATLAQEIETLADFREHASALSDDRGTRQSGGRLGWVTRAVPGVPSELRAAVFEAVDSGRGPGTGTGEEDGHLVGPLELGSGVALLWLADHRPSPGWEEMSVHVHRELRGRKAEEALPPESIETFLDQP